MPLPRRTDLKVPRLRAFARRTKDGPQARRLLALAAIYDGATLTEATKIGGVTLQIVRDWVMKFNAHGPDGLIDKKAPGQVARLNDMHRAALANAIDEGPVPAVHGVVRWRLIVAPEHIEVWFVDEARIGQKNKITRRWAKRGTRPPAPADQRTASTYIFGAICSKDGKGAALVLPRCNIEAMNLHIAEIATQIAPGAHAVLIFDQAGWLSQATSPCLPISPSSLCHQNPRSSIQSRTSGSSCAITGCRTGSSNPTKRSSTIAAMPGTSSSISPGGSCPSVYAIGPQVPINENRYKNFPLFAAVFGCVQSVLPHERSARVIPAHGFDDLAHEAWESLLVEIALSNETVACGRLLPIRNFRHVNVELQSEMREDMGDPLIELAVRRLEWRLLYGRGSIEMSVPTSSRYFRHAAKETFGRAAADEN
jgi:transposase